MKIEPKKMHKTKEGKNKGRKDGRGWKGWKERFEGEGRSSAGVPLGVKSPLALPAISAATAAAA